MTTTASIILFKNEFIATLSDGRRIERSDLRELANALTAASVQAASVSFDWNGSAGQRMVTAGQQVALRAEMRRLEGLLPKSLAVAA
jgi:hypothetical protein